MAWVNSALSSAPGNNLPLMTKAGVPFTPMAIGVNGTPAFVINGKLFPGALDKAELTQAIKTARADLKAR